MIKPRTVEAVKDLPVHDVLRKFGVDLQRAGSGYEACCPLHGERNPSLKVSVRRNCWKCFSCQKGGNGVDFVMESEGMEFSDAVVAIAKSFGIEVEYDRTERTAEQEEAARHLESLRAAAKAAQDFYVAQFQEQTPEAKAAREYAYARWGQEMCTKSGIGYAPKDSRLIINYLHSKGVPEKIALEIGILGRNENSANPYAMLRDRVTIPIRDRWSRVIGFSARYMGDRKDIGKYMNSTTSPLYQKESSVFGIDKAYNAARASGFYIVVEGAPDVLRLHSVGLNEAVGTLGTALTEKHLEAMGRSCKTLRFIPDSDCPKNGAAYGAGIQAVMTNGCLALKHGFEVSVREIPRTPDDDRNGIKHDADTYVTSKEVYAAMEDVPFVVWYAGKRFATAVTQDEKLKILDEVAALLTNITEEMHREVCIDQLCRMYGKVKIWRDALRSEGRKLRMASHSHEVAQDFPPAELEALRQNGIIIKSGCYYSPDAEGNLVRWSNFIFRPVLHIVDPVRSSRILRMINQQGHEEIIELTSADMVSMRDFRRKLIDKGNFVWRSEQSSSLTALQEYLFRVTNSATKVDSLGWNQDGEYYAFSDGLFVGGKFRSIDTLGTVEHNGKRWFLPPYSELYADRRADYNFERQFSFSGDGGVAMRDFVTQLSKVYGNGGRIGFAWIMACAFRDVVFEKLHFFPILNLFGRKGSGKTELAKALASVFYVERNTPSSCSNTSIPAMAYMMAHVSNGVVIFDEFTNDLKPERIDIIKGIWGGTSQSKMNMEDKRPVKMPVHSGVILGGQYCPDDEAIFSRVIHLHYSQTSFSPEEAREFERLQAMAMQGNSHLLLQLLSLRRTVEKGFGDAYSLTVADVTEKIRGMGIEDRIRKNWIVPLAVFRLLEPHLDLPFTYRELMDIIVKGMRSQNEQISRSSDTADFWMFLDALHSTARAQERCHFFIRTQTQFKGIGEEHVRQFVEPKRILYLNFRAVRLLLENRINRTKGGNTLSIETLEAYLRTMPQYMGRSTQRFVLTRPNGDIYEEHYMENGVHKRRTKGNFQKAMCFDYDSLVEKFEISLETREFLASEEALGTELFDDMDI